VRVPFIFYGVLALLCDHSLQHPVRETAPAARHEQTARRVGRWAWLLAPTIVLFFHGAVLCRISRAPCSSGTLNVYAVYEYASDPMSRLHGRRAGVIGVPIHPALRHDHGSIGRKRRSCPASV